MRIFAFLAFAALITIASPAMPAAEFGSKDEAVAMVKRVQDEFKKAGPDATFKDVSDKAVKEFHDRDLYPFIYDMSGKCVAHGARPALIGKNLIDLKDQDGKFLIREMVDMAKGPGTAGSPTSGRTRSTTRSKTSSATSKRWATISSASASISSNSTWKPSPFHGHRAAAFKNFWGLRSVFGVLNNLSIQIKASAASAVLLICLLALGANAYMTSTKSAEGLRLLSHEIEGKLQAVSNVSDAIVTTHLKIFRYVSWASNSVSKKLLDSLQAEINANLAELSRRIDELSRRPDLSDAERASLQDLKARWQKCIRQAKDNHRRRPNRRGHGDHDARADRRQLQGGLCRHPENVDEDHQRRERRSGTGSTPTPSAPRKSSSWAPCWALSSAAS